MQTFKIEKNDTQCVVSWRYSGGCSILFCIVWLAGWTVGCVMLAQSAPFFVKQSPIVFPLFASIFYLLWFAGLALLLNTLFGKTRIVLDETGLESTWTFLFIKRKRGVELENIRWFERFDVESREPGYSVTSQFRAVCQKKNSNYYGLPASEEEVDALCEQLNAFLETLKQSGECTRLRLFTNDVQ